MPRLLAIVALACLTALPLAAPAPAAKQQGAVIKPPRMFKADIAQMRAESGIDVFVPSRIRVATSARRVRSFVRHADGSWDLDLGIGRNCHAGTRCYLANFAGVRGEEPAFTRRVDLARGHTGYWKKITCRASCSPAAIQWVHRGVLYEIATKGATRSNQRTVLVRLANSAIAGGPR